MSQPGLATTAAGAAAGPERRGHAARKIDCFGQPLLGFTLIELLVVVAIIALLLAVLLPSLSRSRKLAQSTVCLAHLRSTGTGLNIYASEFSGWLAGPNTSGLDLSINYSSYSGQDITGPTDPVQNLDWISPTLGVSLGLPSKRIDRLLDILNTKLSCPANKEYYSGVYTGGSGSGSIGTVEPTSVKYSSYAAAMAFHVYRSSSDAPAGLAVVNLASQVDLPKGYAPKLERVGSVSTKIYALDGTRYVNTATSVTFNNFIRQLQGGNFMVYGPATPRGGDPHRLNNDLSLRPENERFAYRHLRRINAAFFDGHAESLTTKESVKVSLFFPTNSTITNASITLDPEDQNGPIP